jgi:hypothetical protein
MPTLKASIRQVDTSTLKRIPAAEYMPHTGVPVGLPLPPSAGTPGLNCFLRCPMPMVDAQPDTLRQFYRDGLPQQRVILPSL